MTLFPINNGHLIGRIALVAIGVITLIGCGKNSDESVQEETTGDPVTAPLIEAWQSEETDDVLRLVREIDWTAKPLFPSSSPLSLSEKGYAAAAKKARPGPGPDLTGEIQRFLKPLSREIAHAGKTAVLQGDIALAKDYFSALHEFGVALTDSEMTVLVQMVGKSFVQLAEDEQALLKEE